LQLNYFNIQIVVIYKGGAIKSLRLWRFLATAITGKGLNDATFKEALIGFGHERGLARSLIPWVFFDEMVVFPARKPSSSR
jgi:hypothetical protein